VTRYRTIVADPPWNRHGRSPWGGGTSRPLPYPTMTIDEIAALPVRELADKQAHLYLWTINAYLEETYEIARLWGFKPSTLLTWTKPKRAAVSAEPTDYTECPVRATGDAPRRSRSESEPFRLAAASEHSQKPEAFLRHGRNRQPRPVPRDVRPPRPLRLGLLGQPKSLGTAELAAGATA
jgi:transposase-like protein